MGACWRAEGPCQMAARPFARCSSPSVWRRQGGTGAPGAPRGNSQRLREPALMPCRVSQVPARDGEFIVPVRARGGRPTCLPGPRIVAVAFLIRPYLAGAGRVAAPCGASNWRAGPPRAAPHAACVDPAVRVARSFPQPFSPRRAAWMRTGRGMSCHSRSWAFFYPRSRLEDTAKLKQPARLRGVGSCRPCVRRSPLRGDKAMPSWPGLPAARVRLHAKTYGKAH